mmetsp:Transcript_29399/g.44436  ORF Transcript_29399/g.44436 Transcript_29399/m.44436 type:complete len:185 (+) Transcript_29399:1692-2246(+)
MTILFSTPITNAKLINSGLQDVVGEDSQAYQFFFKMIGPIGMAIFNSFFIPMLVFWTTEYLFFEKKTTKVQSRLRKYFFYLIVNTIFLPITKLDTIKQLLDYVQSVGLLKLVQQRINNNLISESQFFLRYILTTTFLSQSLVLLDLSHWFSHFRAKRAHNKKDDLENLRRQLVKDGELEKDEMP